MLKYLKKLFVHSGFGWQSFRFHKEEGDFVFDGIGLQL
jgi:hypothetical protein